MLLLPEASLLSVPLDAEHREFAVGQAIRRLNHRHIHRQIGKPRRVGQRTNPADDCVQTRR